MSERDRRRRQRTSAPKRPGDDRSSASAPAQRKAAAPPQADPSPSETPRTPMQRPLPREQKSPKRVRFGLKLTDATGLAGRNEVASQWLDTLNSMIDAEGKQEGLEYARLGQTINMDITPGLITAEVQGRRGRPYTVKLAFTTLSDAQWSRLINTLAGDAPPMAKLLAGELPDRFLQTLDSLDRKPASGHGETANDETETGNRTILDRPQVTCGCGYHRPCKHAAAVGYLLVEQLNDEPQTALTLLGMASDQVRERLRQMRIMKTQGVASAHPELAAFAHEQPLPLEACVDDFWRFGPQLAELEQSPLPHHVPHALLRRLGPSPLSGRFPMVGLLASVYDTVAKAAIALRDEAERGEDE